MPPIITAVCEYLQRGWPIFPVWAAKKTPYFEGWRELASTDPHQIETWWQRWPDALPGVPAGRRSGLVLLDIDVKPPKPGKPWSCGFDTLAELGRSLLPETPMVHTPSGGLHLHFAARADVEIGTSTGKYGLGPGLDVRGEGGMIIMPAPGSGYTWDPHYNLDTVALLPAPPWLGHRAKPEREHSRTGRRGLNPQAILDTACINIRNATDGTRHHVLNREAFSIAGLVAAGAIEERTARHQLAAATAAMVWGSRGDRKKAWKDLADAFSDGLKAPRRAARR